MSEAKIRLSAKEAELIGNADWILTKNEILKKVKDLLGVLHEEQLERLNTIKSHLPKESILSVQPKISKGENYKGLPYLVLDFPRDFNGNEIQVIRSMFWWSNFFSCTLHLAGTHKKGKEKRIISQHDLLGRAEVYVCINEDPWQHHFDTDNYIPIKELDLPRFEKIIKEKPFIKLAMKHPLDQWDNATKLLLEDFWLFFTTAF